MNRMEPRLLLLSSPTGSGDLHLPPISFYTDFRFRPTGKIMFSDIYVHDIAEDLKTIAIDRCQAWSSTLILILEPLDSVLYEILALNQPEELGGQEIHIGNLVLRSV